MPSVSSWSKWKPPGQDSDHIHNNALSSSRRVLSDADLTAVACQCHPNQTHCDENFLCTPCQRFIDDCHWVKNYKLPEGKFSRLSKRHWNQGAYLADGDASEGLNWDYVHPASGLSSVRALRQLLGDLKFWFKLDDDQTFCHHQTPYLLPS